MAALDRALLKAFFALAFVIGMLLLMITNADAQEIAPERAAFIEAVQKQRATIDSHFSASLEPRYIVKKFKLFGLTGELEAHLTRDYRFSNYTWSKIDRKAREYGMRIYTELTERYGQPIDIEEQDDYVYFGWHAGMNTVGLSVTSTWVTYSAMPTLYNPSAAKTENLQEYLDRTLFPELDGRK